MSRIEKVYWLIEAIYAVEEARVRAGHFDDMTDDELDAEMEWYDYLLDK